MPNTVDAWPHYEVGPRKHIHALGVVAANYNQLEVSLFLLFGRYTQLGVGPALSLFGSLSNNLRLNLLSVDLSPEISSKIG
jgi:hypothetical protein